MDDFDLHIIAQKSIKGVFALVSRTFIIQILGVVANLVLASYLDPASYGVYFIASSIVVFLNYFQDIGLAASLIQKKDQPTLLEFRTAFTVQQMLVLLFVIPSLIFSRHITAFYHLNDQGYWLFISLVISFFFSSLRTIPTVILERRLDFNKLVLPQIIENLLYFLALIAFAMAGFGVTSFTIAIMARGIAGLIATYVIQPWEIGFSFDKKTFKHLLSYGVPFQANSILALLKDDLLNLYIGRVLPLSQVGIIGFAQKIAFMPLRLIMDNVIRISFPSFSRLQHDTDALKKAIEKSLFLISFFIFPTAVALIMYSPNVIAFIPKWHKWEPAVFSIAFFALNTVMSSISTPLTNFLNAIGKVRTTLNFMVMWTILTWGLTPLLIHWYGFNGVAIASFLVSLSSFVVLIAARKYVSFSYVNPVIRQLAAAIIMCVYIFLTRGIITTIPIFLLHMVLSGLIYLIVLFLIAREELLKTFRFVLTSIRMK